MKVLETIISKGYFWLPQNPDEQLPGELHVSKFGQIELNLMGVFESPEQDGLPALISMFDSDNHDIDRICGRTLDGNWVTLLNCLRSHFNINLAPGHPSSSSFDVSFALVGVNLEERDALFTAIKFTMEGLGDWLDFNNIQHSTKTDSEEKTQPLIVEGAVDYLARTSPWYNLNDGIKLQFHSPIQYDFSQYPSLSLTLRSQPNISLISHKPKHIKDFIELADIILKFVSLAVDQEVQFQSFTLLTDNENQVALAQLYFRTRVSRRPEYKHRTQKTLFTLADIEEKLEDVMNAWVKLFDRRKIGPALNLYFAAAWKETEFLDTNTLFLAQAAEVLHRKTFPQNKPMDTEVFKKVTKEFFKSTTEDIPDLIQDRIRLANNPSLRNRVEEMMSPFEDWFRDNEQSIDFAKRVSNTRNHFTHYSSGPNKNYHDSEHLMDLHNKIEALLLLHILRLIGFTDSQISQMINNSQRLGKILQAPYPENKATKTPATTPRPETE